MQSVFLGVQISAPSSIIDSLKLLEFPSGNILSAIFCKSFLDDDKEISLS